MNVQQTRLFLCLFVLLCMTGPAHAILINVDPGVVGSQPSEMVMLFSDFDGSTFDGSQLTLDLEFSKMKHVEVGIQDLVTYRAELEFAHDGDFLAGDEFPAFHTGFLSDENADPIISSINNVALGQGDSNHVLANSFAYLLTFFSPDASAHSSDPDSELLFDGLIHHDVHFDLTLPNTGDMITGAALHLYALPLVDGPGNPLGDIDFLIGEWEQIPEPATGTMLMLGMAAILAGSRAAVSRLSRS